MTFTKDSPSDLAERVARLEDEQSTPESIDVQINHLLVISREQAEREGRDILGEVDTPGETEHVKVEP